MASKTMNMLPLTMGIAAAIGIQKYFHYKYITPRVIEVQRQTEEIKKQTEELKQINNEMRKRLSQTTLDIMDASFKAQDARAFKIYKDKKYAKKMMMIKPHELK